MARDITAYHAAWQRGLCEPARAAPFCDARSGGELCQSLSTRSGRLTFSDGPAGSGQTSSDSRLPPARPGLGARIQSPAPAPQGHSSELPTEPPPPSLNCGAIRRRPRTGAACSTHLPDVVFDACFLENAGGFNLTGRAGELIAQGKALLERLADVQARKAQLAKQELSLSLDISDARRALLEELQLQRQRRREGPPSPPSPQHPAAGACEAAAPQPTQAEVRVKQEAEAGAALGPSSAALKPLVLRAVGRPPSSHSPFAAVATSPLPPLAAPPPHASRPTQRTSGEGAAPARGDVSDVPTVAAVGAKPPTSPSHTVTGRGNSSGGARSSATPERPPPNGCTELLGRHSGGGSTSQSSSSAPSSPSLPAQSCLAGLEAGGQAQGTAGLEELARVAVALERLASLQAEDSSKAMRRAACLERTASYERPAKRQCAA